MKECKLDVKGSKLVDVCKVHPHVIDRYGAIDNIQCVCHLHMVKIERVPCAGQFDNSQLPGASCASVINFPSGFPLELFHVHRQTMEKSDLLTILKDGPFSTHNLLMG